jgi:hypothetical protein
MDKRRLIGVLLTCASPISFAASAAVPCESLKSVNPADATQEAIPSTTDVNRRDCHGNSR